MKTFRALTTTVAVSVDDTLPLANVAHAIIASFPRADTAEVHYTLTAHAFTRDGTRMPVDRPFDVVPAFELDLYREIGTRAAPGWLLHAAALEVNGQALVLCGPSGAGKTTLALALVQRGFRLLTEEIVWIGDDGTVRGLPRAIHIPADSPQRARIPAAWQQLPYPIQQPSGATLDNLLVVPPPETFVLEPRPLAAIVRMGHGRDWEPFLRESPNAEALQRLWDRSLRQDETGLQTATTVLRRHSSFELSSRTEAEALALLGHLLK